MIHSYALKTLVWDHHYVQRCCEETDLGSCITQMLTKLHRSLSEGLNHPVHTRKIVNSTMAPVELLMIPTKTFPSTERVMRLIKGLEKVSKVSLQDYSFKKCSVFMATSGFRKCFFKFTKFYFFIFSFVMYITTFWMLLSQAKNPTFIIVGSCTIGLSIATLWCPIYSKPRMLAFISMYNISEYRFSLCLICSFSITHMICCMCFMVGNAAVSIWYVFMGLTLFYGIFLMFSNMSALRRHLRTCRRYATFVTFVGFILYLVLVISNVTMVAMGSSFVPI